MFEILQEKLQKTFKKLKGHGRLSEKNITDALQEVKMALLDADVNFKVVKHFISSVKEDALGHKVFDHINPGEQFIKIVHDKLCGVLGAGEVSTVSFGVRPQKIMLVGLQGCGKTTSAAKLAKRYHDENRKVLLYAGDTQRPAAIEQLEILARQIGVSVLRGDNQNLCADLDKYIADNGFDVVIYDTAGRLQVASELMSELADAKKKFRPHEVLLVVDAMTGQTAVDVASEFDRVIGIDALIMTKLDGDARGGAALSVRWVTGKPIKYIGVGEKIGEMEVFRPDGLASRILGKGDVVGLVEKAQKIYDNDAARLMERKLRKNTFDLEDFRDQLSRMKKLGPMDEMLGMIPGLSGKLKGNITAADPKQFDRIEAIICSMTPDERRNPGCLDASRRRRISKGSGTGIQDVNELIKKFEMMKKMTKNIAKNLKSNRMINNFTYK